MRVHEKHGVLLAGRNGVKIYYLNKQYRLVKGRKFVDLPCNVEAIANYVNLKYQPLSMQESTVEAFEAYVARVLS